MTQQGVEKTSKMLFQTEEEIFSKLVSSDHPFRKLNSLLNFTELALPFIECYSAVGAPGIPLEKGLKTLLVQFWEDYSDRQAEKAVQENIAVRWFCGFSLTEDTPDHSYFGKLRQRIGTKRLADLFNTVNTLLAKHGLFGNVFTFIDASTIITKTALWEERDQAIKDGEEKMNNVNVSRYAADTQAKFGAKSKTNFWFGYKLHEAVDMRYGLIKKLCITPANTPDYQAVKHICPDQGLVYMDKGYDYQEVDLVLQANGCSSAIIRKNNNTEKNHDLDSWHSKSRMPFESTFSKRRKRARYRGEVKVLFQYVAEAICLNLKKALRILPLNLTA